LGRNLKELWRQIFERVFGAKFEKNWNYIQISSICRQPASGLWGPFLTSPLGANVDPQGWILSLGVKLSPGGEILCSTLHSSKQ
jgi:hypothetical protein